MPEVLEVIAMIIAGVVLGCIPPALLYVYLRWDMRREFARDWAEQARRNKAVADGWDERLRELRDRREQA